LTGAPHGAVVLGREAIQMSSPPLPPGRFDARYRLRPSGDWIGQPSSEGVLISGLFPPITSIFWADAQAADASSHERQSGGQDDHCRGTSCETSHPDPSSLAAAG